MVIIISTVLALFPFGQRNGDDVLPQGVDQTFGPFSTFPVLVPFFQKQEREFYVRHYNYYD